MYITVTRSTDKGDKDVFNNTIKIQTINVISYFIHIMYACTNNLTSRLARRPFGAPCHHEKTIQRIIWKQNGNYNSLKLAHLLFD